jgi:hypothetical protein
MDPADVKASATLLLLGATSLLAAPPENQTIAAGPFRVAVPNAFAKGVVVEKVIRTAFTPPTLGRRGLLHYLFLGLSDDDSCPIIATFLLALPGLPDDSRKATHLGCSNIDYEKLSKEFDRVGGQEGGLPPMRTSSPPKLEDPDTMMTGWS